MDENSRTEYFMPVNAPAELLRLLRQEDDVTGRLPFFPPFFSPADKSVRIIDLACGPGGWLRTMAEEFPRAKLIGVDIQSKMIEYARSSAADSSYQLTLIEADITDPELFQKMREDPFDLVHLRMAGGFLKRAQWLPLLENCYKQISSGGAIYLGEWGNWKLPPSLDAINKATARGLWQEGMNFMADTYSYGPALETLLKEAGYQHVERIVHPFHYQGNHEYRLFEENVRIAIYNVGNFLVGKKILSAADYERLRDGAVEELNHPELHQFQTNFETIWAQKP